MSVSHVVVIAAVLASASAATAGVTRDLGRDFAKGALEKLQPALASTLADAEARATRLEDHLGTVAGELLDQGNAKAQDRLEQVDHILEARLLQARVQIEGATDHALSGVDRLMQDSLTRAQQVVTALSADAFQRLTRTLDHASQILQRRLADVERTVNGAIEKADRTLATRIDQVDEAVGRRLGNLDVIASKQRLAIEETAVRTAVLIGLVIFTVFLLRRLYARYLKLVRPAGKVGRVGQGRSAGDRDGRRDDAVGPEGPRGADRTWMFARGLGVPLIGHLCVAAAGAGVLTLLYHRLPLGARHEAAALLRTHEAGFAESLQRFDFARARFHASQLEYLAPDDPVVHGGLLAKTEVLRDVFLRPTILATETGVAGLWQRITETDRIFGPQPDPDLLVVKAMLLWQTGASRRDELRAASLCARALRVRPRAGGFTLAPLARAYIETFVDAPFREADASLGRDSYTVEDLQAVLDYAPPVEPTHPLAARVQLLRLMRTVDAQASTAYKDTLERHLDVVAASRRDPARLAAARGQRREAAQRVLDAWKAFDAALAAPDWARDPAVLMVFRLNDALYTRAKWFVDHPDTLELAPLLADPAPSIKTQVSPRWRLQLAPPRLVWARRYQPLIEGPARVLFELQESERFAAFEFAARQLEEAMVATLDGKRTARYQAAQVAALLGLYVSDAKAAGPRTPYAKTLVPVPDAALDQAMQGRGIQLY